VAPAPALGAAPSPSGALATSALAGSGVGAGGSPSAPRWQPNASAPSVRTETQRVIVKIWNGSSSVALNAKRGRSPRQLCPFETTALKNALGGEPCARRLDALRRAVDRLRDEAVRDAARTAATQRR